MALHNSIKNIHHDKVHVSDEAMITESQFTLQLSPFKPYMYDLVSPLISRPIITYACIIVQYNLN